MRLLVLGALLALGGCAAVALPDQAGDFTKATKDYAVSLQAYEPAKRSAERATGRVALEAQLAHGVPLASLAGYQADCASAFLPAQAQFDAARVAKPYDPAVVDQAYLGLRMAHTCSLPGLSDPPLPAPLAAPERPGSIDGPGAPGQDRLADIGVTLAAFTQSVADAVANTSGAKRDAARNDLIATSSALLDQTGLKAAGAAGGMVGQVVTSVLAANQNRDLGKMLAAYDAVMPNIMERTGHAARLATEAALSNRLQAAQTEASTYNSFLRDPTFPPPQKLALLKTLAADLDTQDDAIICLRAVDPMDASRAYAAAFHELVEDFNGGKGRAAARNAGLKSFKNAATALNSAVK